jgi:uncharacterized membrane protein YtjA (UPF0391 family)
MLPDDSAASFNVRLCVRVPLSNGLWNRGRRGPLSSDEYLIHKNGGGIAMLRWALTFLVIALVAAIFGFGIVGGIAVAAARIVFLVALALFVLATVIGLLRVNSPPLH